MVGASTAPLRGARVGAHDVGAFHPMLEASTLAATPGLAKARFVAPDVGGGLLVGCGPAICLIDAGRVARLDAADGLPPDAWQVALRAADGTLWTRSLDRLAWRKPGEAMFHVVAVPGQRGYFAGNPGQLGLVSDGGGVLTQGASGLLDWDGTAWRGYSHHEGGLPTSAVQSCRCDREGSLWVGSSGYGAFRSLGLGEWEHWTTDDGLPSNTVWSMARLDDGRLWVATEDGTAPLGDKPDLIPGSDYAVAATRGGRLWVAPIGAPLVRLDHRTGRTERFPSVGKVFTAAVDREDRLWLCTRMGLFVVEDADAPASAINPRLALSQTRMQVLTDPSGEAWIVGQEGVFRRDTSGRFVRVVAASLLRGQPNDAAFSPGGDLWVATESAGVLRFRLDGTQAVIHPSLAAPEIGSDAVLHLHRDRRGWIWVGTDHGIDAFDGRSWRRFDSTSGPITDDLDEWSVHEDADGSMWFGTTHGLSHLIDPQGTASNPVPHPRITQVRLGVSALPLTPKMTVDWSSAPLVVRFVDLDYSLGRIAFRYRLRGLDADWTETTGREVRYASLPAGDLGFELVAVDRLHGTTSASIGFTIHVRAPWWRRWWFYASCAIGGILLIGGAWQARVRLLVQQRRRLEEVVTARTAEIEQARRELQRRSMLERQQLEGEQRRLEDMVAMRTAEIEQAGRELLRLAMSDALTSLANRRAIMETLEAAISHALAFGAPLAVLICDLDHFKRINDEFGHLTGDSVLATFGSRLKAAMTASEAAGRYGGEEFLIVLPGPSDPVKRRVAAIRSALCTEPYRFGDTDRKVTFSGGLAFLERDDTALTLIARADAALYQAKGYGRDRIEQACPEPAAVRASPQDAQQRSPARHELG